VLCQQAISFLRALPGAPLREYDEARALYERELIAALTALKAFAQAAPSPDRSSRTYPSAIPSGDALLLTAGGLAVVQQRASTLVVASRPCTFACIRKHGRRTVQLVTLFSLSRYVRVRYTLVDGVLIASHVCPFQSGGSSSSGSPAVMHCSRIRPRRQTRSVTHDSAIFSLARWPLLCNSGVSPG